MIALLDLAVGPNTIFHRTVGPYNPWPVIIIGVVVLAAVVTAIVLIAKAIKKNRGNDKGN